MSTLITDRRRELASRSLVAALCGTLALGFCLHMAVGVAAVALGVGMLVIAFAGDASPWVGLGLIMVLGALAVLRFGTIRQQR